MKQGIKKILVDMDESQLKENLEKYKKKAIELGASNACIFSVKDIPVDERVTLKCQVPRCFGYGVSANCPPNTITPDELRTYLGKYKWAIFFIKDVPSEVIVRDKSNNKGKSGCIPGGV